MDHKKISERGFSLLELLLVVGVGALLLLGGLGVYRLVTQGNKTNEAIRLLTTIKNQTQLVFQNQAVYEASGAGTDMVPILISAGAIPTAYVSSATAAVDPWGRAMAIDVAGGGSEFQISFNDVSPEACIAIAGVFNTNTDSDFVGLDVNSNTDVDTTSVSALTTACSGDSNDEYDMVWTFY